MPSTPQIIRMRQHRREVASKNPTGWIGAGCSLTIVITLSLLVLGVAAFYLQLTAALPAVELLPVMLDPEQGLLLEPTKIYDRSGEHLLITLENPAAPGRQILSLDQNQPNFIPTALISATLAIADPQFWNHPGSLDFGLSSNKKLTIAERLTSDLLLWQEPPGLRRRLRVSLLAMQITARYGREQMLAWYLNSADYGRLAYGADAAARLYFGKPAAALTLAEAAILAATSQAPDLNPQDAPELARQRGLSVLDAMLSQGWISASQWQAAREAQVVIQPAQSVLHELAPAYVNLVLAQAGRYIDLSRLQRGGFRLITTLDYDLQTQSACAAAALIARLQNRPEPSQTFAGQPCKAARLLPALAQTPSDPALAIQAQIVIQKPTTGEILAMVDGADSTSRLASLLEHPAGTLLTPLIYLTGFTRGMSPATLLWDIPGVSASQDMLAQDRFHGPVRLRIALANDYLIPADQVLSQVGGENVWQIARELGLDTFRIEETTPITRFTQDIKVSLLDACHAYSALANQGILAGANFEPLPIASGSTLPEPVALLRLEDTGNRVWGETGSPATRPVISAQLAYLITHILSDEPARWQSLGHPNPLEIGRPAAAKLGKTASGTDAWAVGYTPDLVVGTWLGTPNQPPPAGITPELAAALWHAVIQYASREIPPRGWQAPQGITTLQVCDPSGLLPTDECPNVVNEIFISGNEPTQPDNLFQRIPVNRETGRIATVFTSPALIEERTYLIVPPEAETWARQSGLPLPPETYDVIPAEAASPGARINSPAMFSYVRGKVSIVGSASGDDFQYYRLQAGKGLNPSQWEQVTGNITQPVNQGQLGVWDTQGLNGLYAIQLLVVRTNQQVNTAVIQVTVDNRPPQVDLLYPAAGQIFDKNVGMLTLRAEASDDLGLSRVEFLIDGKLIAGLDQEPYAVPWRAVGGRHQLTVHAVDQAGNRATASLEFTVQP